MNEEEAIIATRAFPCLCEEVERRFLYRLAMTAPKGLPFIDLGTHLGGTAVVLCAAAEEQGCDVITIDNYSYDSIFQGYPLMRPRDHALGVCQRLLQMGFNPYVRIGDSAGIPFALKHIGLLLIDTEHTGERLNTELDAWLPLLAEGGILAAHDYQCPVTPGVTEAIDKRVVPKTKEWECLGIAKWLVGFRKIRGPHERP